MQAVAELRAWVETDPIDPPSTPAPAAGRSSSVQVGRQGRGRLDRGPLPSICRGNTGKRSPAFPRRWPPRPSPKKRSWPGGRSSTAISGWGPLRPPRPPPWRSSAGDRPRPALRLPLDHGGLADLGGEHGCSRRLQRGVGFRPAPRSELPRFRAGRRSGGMPGRCRGLRHSPGWSRGPDPCHGVYGRPSGHGLSGAGDGGSRPPRPARRSRSPALAQRPGLHRERVFRGRA